MNGRGGWRRGSGRKAGWRHGETQTIRVPVALKEQLLEIGRQLDEGEEIYDGDTYSELQAIVNKWQAKCDANAPDSPEWQQVSQLLKEIREIGAGLGNTCVAQTSLSRESVNNCGGGCSEEMGHHGRHHGARMGHGHGRHHGSMRDNLV